MRPDSCLLTSRRPDWKPPASPVATGADNARLVLGLKRHPMLRAVDHTLRRLGPEVALEKAAYRLLQ
ncbi:hypothetical protein NDU88_006186 [Pleurodeles waltl]|uniref:Uncharacterized protein n=1 Tax=Pleurodeles waltl TaxID=8319 RepID=A0AAV7WZZ2_PLEWA|nr:hypothetical protein NDU88_006186 [Pleurodeles waltl]